MGTAAEEYNAQSVYGDGYDYCCDVDNGGDDDGGGGDENDEQLFSKLRFRNLHRRKVFVTCFGTVFSFVRV